MDSGCYQLKIRIERGITLTVGALGPCYLAAGDYVYTGSAMKNLRRRIARHKSKDKKLHWHIDYVLAQPGVRLLEVVPYPSGVKEECRYNQLLLSHGATVPVPGFGSSDCKNCPAHFLKVSSPA